MQIFRTLAGYSLGRADIVRRAMSKKKLAVMESEREIFIHGLTDDDGNIIVEGCIRRGVDEKTAISVYDEMGKLCTLRFQQIPCCGICQHFLQNCMAQMPLSP